MYLFIDFETYSPVDLKETGVTRYARHPDADVICGVFSLIDDNRKVMHRMALTRSILQDKTALFNFKFSFSELYALSSFIIAHNLEFDLEIYTQILQKRYNFLEIDANKKLVCTKKRQMFFRQELDRRKLGSSLKKASEWFNLLQQKQERGKFLIEKLSIPDKKTGLRNYDDALEAEMLEYCMQDVKTLECLFFAQQDFAKLFKIRNNDYKVQVLDTKINQTGFPVNLDLAQKILEVADEEKARAQLDFCKHFDDYSLPSLTQDAAIKKFIQTKFNYTLHSFTDIPSNIPSGVAEVISFRENARKSSLAKANAILAREYKGRIYGAFQYHGVHVGRWSGLDVQPQNLPRTDNEKDPKSFLRNIIATGANSSLIFVDFKSIEHIAAFYLLMKFLEHFGLQDKNIEKHYAKLIRGEDAYLELAADIYRVPLESLNNKSLERSVGKVTHLGAIYGIGGKKFSSYAEDYNIDLSVKKLFKKGEILPDGEISLSDQTIILSSHLEEAIRLVKIYRERYPTVQKLWKYLQNLFISCIQQNEDCEEDLFWDMKLRYVAKLPFRDTNCLCITLPNSRPIFYYNLVIKEEISDWGGTYQSVIIDGESFHGGKFLENIIQAICRDVQAESMLEISQKLELAKIVMHVHDEIVVESLDEKLNFNKSIVEEVCKTPPKWMKGFPLSYELTVSKFYKK